MTAAATTCCLSHSRCNKHLNSKPLQVRGLASGAAATANWLANAIVSQTFLVLTQHLGGSGTFWIYTAVSLGGLLWVFHVLPETNGEPSMIGMGHASHQRHIRWQQGRQISHGQCG